MIVELTGWVPVTVSVDLTDREVTSVNVWDTDFRYGDPTCSQDGLAPGTSKFGSEAQAREIAESATWPGWTFGA